MMPRRSGQPLAAWAAIGMMSAVSVSRAAVPHPGRSHVDPCVVTCPAGDSTFLVIARRADDRPYEVGMTRVSFCGCPTVEIAPVGPGDSYTMFDSCTVTMATDATGTTPFALRSGGTCAGGTVVVDCDGVILATRQAVASFDQDGDMVVDVSDLAAASAKRGTGDPTADFDCDGTVTQADLEILAGHIGHAAGVVGVEDAPKTRLTAVPVPNPGRGAVEFLLGVPERGHGILSIHDLAGRRLATALDCDLEPGLTRAVWSGRDEGGRPVAPGLYFFRLTVGQRRLLGTVVITR